MNVSGVQNNSARIYNLAKVFDDKVVKVNLAPGFNIVDADLWKAFVNGTRIDPYIKKLRKEGLLDWGKAFDEKAEEISALPESDRQSKVANINLKSEAKAAPTDDDGDGTDETGN